MKKKLLLPLAMAALLGLSACVQISFTPPGKSSSEPGKSSEPTSSVTPVEEGSVTGVTVSLKNEGDTATIVEGETLDLVANVVGEGTFDKTVTWSSSDSEIAAVNRATGRVTAKTPGTATITATSTQDSTKFGSIEITVNARAATRIADITTEEVTVKGVVVAKNTKSFIISDGTAGIMVYLNAEPSDYNIGDYVKVAGTPVESKYANGLIQFDNKAVVEKLTDGTMPDIPAAVELTAAKLAAWKAALPTESSAQEHKFLELTEVVEYKWTGVAGNSGGYLTLNMEGSDVVIEPAYLNATTFPTVEGHKYDVKAYFVGYNYHGYAAVVVTSLTEKQAEVGDVIIEAASREVTVGQQLVLNATVAGVDNPTITWSSSDPSIATVADGTVLGVAPGKVTITAEYDADHKATIEITVKSASVAKNLAALELNDVVTLDVKVIGEAYNGFVVGDATGVAYIYTKNYSGENKTPAVGTHLTIAGDVGAYNGGLQIVPSAITVAEGDAPSVLAEQAMTEELGLALAAEAKTAKGNSACLAANRNGIYTFENVAIGGSGNYLTWDLGTAHFETANTADSNKPVSGKNYDLKAIAYGSYTGNNVDYLTMVVIQATEHTGGDTPVTPTGHGFSIDDPFTPAELPTYIDGDSFDATATVYVSGTVKNGSFYENGSSSNWDIYFEAGDKTVQLFRAQNTDNLADYLPENPVNKKATDAPKLVGATVVASGTATKYNDKYELAQGCKVESITSGTTPVDPGEDVISIANLAKESATVKGVVVAKNTKSFLISDGTAGVMVYLNATPSNYAIGDYVKVSGTPVTSKYSNGLLQFDNTATIEKLTDSTMPNIPAAVDLTAEKLAAWKAALPSDTTAQAEKFLELTEVVEYKWTATAAMSGTYLTLNLEGSDVVIEPAYLDTTAFPYTAGKEYSVKGYFVGYNYHDYAAVVITELTEVGGGDTPVDPTPTTTTALGSLELNASVTVDVKVIAEAYNGFLVGDSSGVAYIYTKNYSGENKTPAVGTHLTIAGDVGAYNGGLQVVPSAITVAEGDAPSVLAEVAMTEENGLALAAEAKSAKANSTCLAANHNAIYTFENVAIGGSGNYLTWSLGSANFETTSTADANKPVSGKNYDIKAIAFGIYSSGSTDYLTMIVVEATEHAGGDTPVDPTPGESAVVSFVAGTDKGSVSSGSAGSVEGGDSVTKDGVTITVAKSLLGRTDHYKVGKGDTLTIDAGNGTITKIEMTFNASGDAKYGPTSFGTPEGYTYSGAVGTWVGSASSIVFNASVSQAQILSIVVTYTAA